jgi:tetratricopeptide (TPR) repeat protein
MQLNSGSGYARHWYAHSLEAQGRLAEAMPEMRNALELDPLSIPIRWDIGSELLSAERAPEAIDFLKKASDLFPNVPVFTFLLSMAYQHVGDNEAARRTLETLRTGHPELKDDLMFMTMSGVEAALAGRAADARAALEKMEDLRRSRYVDAFLVLPLCAALHDRAETLRWLRRAYEDRSAIVVYLPMLKSFYGLDDGMLADVAGK